MPESEQQEMYKGTIQFRARIKGNGLSFPELTFSPNEVGVEKVEIASQNGNEITSVVHVTAVPTEEAGRAIASKVNTTALDRLSFLYNIAIENGEITDSQFTSLNPPPGHHLRAGHATMTATGGVVNAVRGFSADRIKADLEQESPISEQYFGLFRSARLSESPVEEFIHLYNLLLMLIGDLQKPVDDFIMREVPTTQLGPSGNPKAKAGETETIYTRLRNELGHHRKGVNLNTTKADMAKCVGDLATLTKKAIELYHKKED
jgi:hypothetical protein